MSMAADAVAQLNAALGEALKDDPAGAVRAHAAVMPIITELVRRNAELERSAVAVQPDTFFIARCPGWPGGITMPTMDEALRFIAKRADQETCLATWCNQYQRRDYSPAEVRSMIAALQAGTGAADSR